MIIIAEFIGNFILALFYFMISPFVIGGYMAHLISIWCYFGWSKSEIHMIRIMARRDAKKQ